MDAEGGSRGFRGRGAVGSFVLLCSLPASFVDALLPPVWSPSALRSVLGVWVTVVGVELVFVRGVLKHFVTSRQVQAFL